MKATRETSRGHALGGGVVAGLIGGAVLSIVLMIVSAVNGQDVWLALKGAGTPFLHERAQQIGFDAPAVVLGLITHFAISVVWGVLFALVFYGLSKGATVLAGALSGVISWLGMYYIVLPLVGLAQVAQGPIAPALIMHVVFGLAIGIGFLPFQRTRTHVVPPATRAPLAW